MRWLPNLGSVLLSVVLLAGASPAWADDRPPKTKPVFRDFMGLNVHTVQFKAALYKPVTRLLRDYHGFNWDVGDETNYVPKFPMARNRVNWETLYGEWKTAGCTIDVCWMFDTTAPNAWSDVARDAERYGYEFARFFGPSGKQKLVESVEIGNEPGKYDDATYRKLFENAARGMRRGDPELRVATCATFARPSGPYHKDVATVKGLESLYDVINVHSYAELELYPTWRRSFPEDGRLDFLTKIRDVIAWRNANAPGKEIWLTEFGWDATTKPQATEGDFKRWVGVTDVQQAEYLVRAFLVLCELDLDRAYIYWFNDDDQPAVHMSSGLTRHYQPKPAFHAVAHLFATLGDYRFHRVVSHKPGEVYIHEFRHGAKPNQLIWAVWSPTGEGKQGTTRIPRPAGSIQRAERMPVAARPAKPVRWSSAGNGDVELPIGESPVYLWIE